MLTFTQRFAAEKDILAARIKADPDPAAAAEAVRACLARLAQDYVADEDDAVLRQEAAQRFDLLHVAAGQLLCAQDVSVSLRLPGRAAPSVAMKTAGRLAAFIPLILSAVVTLALLPNARLPMVLLAAAATLSCAGLVFAKGRRAAPAPQLLPEAEGVVRVDAQTLISQLESLCLALDRQFSALYDRRQSELESDIPWTQGQYTAAQMLWEAIQAGDSVFALKAAPTLLTELEAQGIELVTYAPDVRLHFDAVPAATAGRTIRPALMRGDKVLARGQVTVPMS